MSETAEPGPHYDVYTPDARVAPEADSTSATAPPPVPTYLQPAPVLPENPPHDHVRHQRQHPAKQHHRNANPGHVARLNDPPRTVPHAFWLGIFAFSFWECFAILMTLVAPIALWIFVPVLLPLALGVLVIVLGGRRWVMARQRLHLARWGKVAVVVDVETRPGISSYQNIRLPRARGWDVEHELYSGMSQVSTVKFLVDNRPGQVEVHGWAYDDGVILADPDRPSDALCVSSFANPMKPDDMGDLVGRLSPWAYLGSIATLLLLAALLVGTLLAGWIFWT